MNNHFLLVHRAALLFMAFFVASCQSLSGNNNQDANNHERSLRVVIQDNVLTSRIKKQIKTHASLFKGSDVVVKAYQGVVLMIGQVPTQSAKDTLTAISEGMDGAASTHNHTQISGKRSIKQKMNDGLLALKVRNAIAKNDDTLFTKVITLANNNSIYFMGSVTRNEADITIDIIKQVPDIERVVKVFTYID